MADDKRRDDYTIEMGERNGENSFEPPRPVYTPPAPSRRSLVNHPMTPILSYCGSSILMTVLNKYVLSPNFTLNFFLLGVQVRQCRVEYRRKFRSLTAGDRVWFALPSYKAAKPWALSLTAILMPMKLGNACPIALQSRLRTSV